MSLSAKAESAPWWQPWRYPTQAPAVPLCSFDRLPPAHLRGWAGPCIGLALPSFRCCSRAQQLHHCCEHELRLPLPAQGCTRLTILLTCSGRTEQHPGLLKYACALDTHVRPVRATAVAAVPPEEGGDAAVATIFGGRPLLALAFDNMEVRQLFCT